MRWHRLLGRMLEELLTPVDITVITEFQIMTDPPEADILLIRRNHPHWTAAQLRLLPDGIRDTAADHILLEFKYTESVNQSVLYQALAYDTFYRRVQKLKPERIQTFIISSKTPARRFLREFGYADTTMPGVYFSSNAMLGSLPVISLNELPDEPQNLFIKCFASRKKQKELAFKKLLKSGKHIMNGGLYRLLTGLWSIYFQRKKGENIMDLDLTPEQLMEMGKDIEEAWLAFLPVEKKLAGLKPSERIAGLKPSERVAGLNPEEILGSFNSAERIAGLNPEDVLGSFNPEDVLAKLSIKDIQAYLNKINK